MTTSLVGLYDWELSRDEEGHIDINATYIAETDDTDDGPITIMGTTGLPTIGSSFSIGNDAYAYALCWPTLRVRPFFKGEPNNFWYVDKLFTTRPMKRCQDDSVENPLNEPPKVSGSFIKTRKQALVDKDGDPILTSSREPIEGLERDANFPSVVIELNVATLPLSTFSGMIDTLNDATLWGLGARRVKLSSVAWERKYYGTCTAYYTLRYEFDINFGTFDETILDEGYLVLAPGGDINNPQDFVLYGGRDDRIQQKAILDGTGHAWDGTGSPGFQTVQFYSESNLLTLGIPTSL